MNLKSAALSDSGGGGSAGCRGSAGGCDGLISAELSGNLPCDRKHFKGKRISCFTKCAAVFLLMSIGFSSVSSSKDIEVTVNIPKEAELNEYVVMKCEWKIRSGKSLYSVKWYKDGHEFFRYVPDNGQRIQTFLQPGVQLDNRLSNQDSIQLVNLTFTSTGQYKCEVSTEGPAFAASFKTGNLTIIAVPEQGPEITGLSSHYAVGENVTANCTTLPSTPKAILSWTINGKPISQEYTVNYPVQSRRTSHGVGSIVGLRLVAEARHFGSVGGSVKIRCLATIGSRSFGAEKLVHMALVNNQRLSAGDHRNSPNNTASLMRLDLMLIVILVIGAT